MKVKAEKIAKKYGIEIIGNGNLEITGISVDSRSINKGDMFVCIKGENYDGHDFIREAIDAGASGVLISDKKVELTRELLEGLSDKNYFVLFLPGKDGKESLINIASKKTSCYPGKIIGITGSSGKTSVREMIKNVLATRYKVHTVSKNYNTEIGMSLEIFKADLKDDYWVLEYGARCRGDIEKLLEIAIPDWAVITNIGFAHLGIMGDRDQIFKEKIFLLSGKRTKKVFYDADDEYSEKIFNSAAGLEKIRVGTDNEVEVKLEDIKLDERGMPGFNVSYGKRKTSVHLNFPGLHNVRNAALAVAVGMQAGVELEKCVFALEETVLPQKRLQILNKNGVLFVNDAYNANPASMKASMEIINNIPVETGIGARRIAVIGDMLELGKEASDLHEEIGDYAAERNIDIIVYVGKYSEQVRKGFQNKKENAVFVKAEDYKQAAEKLKDVLKKGDVVLLKASRLLELDRVFDYV